MRGRPDAGGTERELAWICFSVRNQFFYTFPPASALFTTIDSHTATRLIGSKSRCACHVSLG